MSTPDAATLARWNALAATLDGWRTVMELDPFRENEADEVYTPLFTNPSGALRVPDYAQDLNAVARLEALVRGRDCKGLYEGLLWEIVGRPESAFDAITATAAQRLEAVLLACGLIDADGQEVR